jgi:hypothetical protein
MIECRESDLPAETTSAVNDNENGYSGNNPPDYIGQRNNKIKSSIQYVKNEFHQKNSPQFQQVSIQLVSSGSAQSKAHE